MKNQQTNKLELKLKKKINNHEKKNLKKKMTVFRIV